jgi:hypothetical protein
VVFSGNFYQYLQKKVVQKKRKRDAWKVLKKSLVLEENLKCRHEILVDFFLIWWNQIKIWVAVLIKELIIGLVNELLIGDFYVSTNIFF